jgi:hypothetical protein
MPLRLPTDPGIDPHRQLWDTVRDVQGKISILPRLSEHVDILIRHHHETRGAATAYKVVRGLAIVLFTTAVGFLSTCSWRAYDKTTSHIDSDSAWKARWTPVLERCEARPDGPITLPSLDHPFDVPIDGIVDAVSGSE